MRAEAMWIVLGFGVGLVFSHGNFWAGIAGAAIATVLLVAMLCSWVFRQ